METIHRILILIFNFRNYAGVTNQTLINFVVNGPRLEYLDVTGTSVTKEGLQFFKTNRPNVTIISSFDEI